MILAILTIIVVLFLGVFFAAIIGAMMLTLIGIILTWLVLMGSAIGFSFELYCFLMALTGNSTYSVDRAVTAMIGFGVLAGVTGVILKSINIPNSEGKLKV